MPKIPPNTQTPKSNSKNIKQNIGNAKPKRWLDFIAVSAIGSAIPVDTPTENMRKIMIKRNKNPHIIPSLIFAPLFISVNRTAASIDIGKSIRKTFITSKTGKAIPSNVFNNTVASAGIVNNPMIRPVIAIIAEDITWPFFTPIIFRFIFFYPPYYLLILI